MNEIVLVKYEEACRSLAAAVHVDEVKRIRNEAEAIRAYAKQAKNKQVEIDAIHLRTRAERRLGELMAEQSKTVGKAKGSDRGGKRTFDGLRRNPSNTPPTLGEAGIDKNLAHRARSLAAIPDKEFNTMVANGYTAVPRAPAKKPKVDRRAQVQCDTVDDPDNFDAFKERAAVAIFAAEYTGKPTADSIKVCQNVIKAWRKLETKLEERR